MPSALPVHLLLAHLLIVRLFGRLLLLLWAKCSTPIASKFSSAAWRLDARQRRPLSKTLLSRGGSRRRHGLIQRTSRGAAPDPEAGLKRRALETVMQLSRRGLVARFYRPRNARTSYSSSPMTSASVISPVAAAPELRYAPHQPHSRRAVLRLTNFYANCPSCSPTPASIMTGCYPDRVGVPGVIRTMPAN